MLNPFSLQISSRHPRHCVYTLPASRSHSSRCDVQLSSDQRNALGRLSDRLAATKRHAGNHTCRVSSLLNDGIGFPGRALVVAGRRPSSQGMNRHIDFAMRRLSTLLRVAVISSMKLGFPSSILQRCRISTLASGWSTSRSNQPPTPSFRG